MGVQAAKCAHASYALIDARLRPAYAQLYTRIPIPISPISIMTVRWAGTGAGGWSGLGGGTDASADVEINVHPKLIYSSRTHSQLSQFINEIKKTKFGRKKHWQAHFTGQGGDRGGRNRGGKPGDVTGKEGGTSHNTESDGSAHNQGNHTKTKTRTETNHNDDGGAGGQCADGRGGRDEEEGDVGVSCVVLGSRQNYCIHNRVSRLKTGVAINERCLDLRDSRKNAAKSKSKKGRGDSEGTGDVISKKVHKRLKMEMQSADRHGLGARGRDRDRDSAEDRKGEEEEGAGCPHYKVNDIWRQRRKPHPRVCGMCIRREQNRAVCLYVCVCAMSGVRARVFLLDCACMRRLS